MSRSDVGFIVIFGAVFLLLASREGGGGCRVRVGNTEISAGSRVDGGAR